MFLKPDLDLMIVSCVASVVKLMRPSLPFYKSESDRVSSRKTKTLVPLASALANLLLASVCRLMFCYSKHVATSIRVFFLFL